MKAGELSQYTQQIRNNGPNTIPVEITIPVSFTLPPGLTGVVYAVDNGDYDIATSSITLDSPFAPGEVITITITGFLDQNAEEGTEQASMLIGAPVGVEDPNLVNNSSTQDIEITREVSMELTVTPSSFTPPVTTVMTFTVEVTNHGPSSAHNVEVTALLPNGYTFQGSNAGEDYNSTTGVWTVGTLLSGETVSMDILAEVLETGEYDLSTSVVVDETNTNEYPDTVSTDITPGAAPGNSADLSITVEVDNETPEIGDNVVFTITATNSGPNNGTSVVATGNKPSGLQYVSDDGPYNVGQDKWFMTTLNSGQTKTLHIIFTVLASGSYNYQMVINGAEFDPNLSNNTSSKEITPEGPAAKIIGINAHVDRQDPYRRGTACDYDVQADIAEAIGCNYMRSDILAGADGTIPNTSTSSTFYNWGRWFGESPADVGGSGTPASHNYGMNAKLVARGIKVLPMLYDRLFNSSPGTPGYWPDWTAQEHYDRGYELAYGFVTKYGELWDLEYIELGNEWELGFSNGIKIPGNTGTQQSHYYAEKLIAKHYASGMNAGAKAARPGIKTVFNCAGWFPTYWVDAVLNQSAIDADEIDIVGWHWYSEMQGLIKGGSLPNSPLLPNPGSSYNNITDAVWDMWGKPIWFTEYGYRWSTGKSEAANQADQQAMFVEFYNQQKDDPRVIGLNWHDMVQNLTQQGTPHTSEEQNYAIVRFNNYDSLGLSSPYYTSLANYMATLHGNTLPDFK